MKLITPKKISLFLALSFLLIFFLTSFAFAQRELEVTYPGVEAPTTIKTPLPDYIKYIFNFSLLIAGLVAFASLLYGGFRYLISAGSPSAMTDAKDQIFAGLLGLIILLSAYLILTTINPQLVIVNPIRPSLDQGIVLKKTEGGETIEITYGVSVADLTDFRPESYEILSPLDKVDIIIYEKINYNINPETGKEDETDRKTKLKSLTGIFPYEGITPLSIELRWKPDGVYFCKDCNNWEECKDCVVLQDSSASLPKDIDNEIDFIHFKQSAGVKYGVVLHEDQNFRGNCEVCLNDDDACSPLKVGDDGVSSVTIFLQREGDGEKGVIVYKDYDYGEDNKEEENEYYEFGIGPYLNLDIYKFINCAEGFGHGCGLSDRISSIKVSPGYMAILYPDPNHKGGCEVFLGNDPFLRDNHIKDESASSLKVLPVK